MTRAKSKLPTITYTRPAEINRYKKQRAIIDCPTRYTITEGSTKSGKTVSHIVWLFEQSLQGRFGDNYWWVAPTYSQAKIAFRRLKRYITDKEFFEANESELTIKIVTGGLIFFKTGEKPDNLYGDDVKAIVMDEHTRQRFDAFVACQSTITATKGHMKLIGNVVGSNNWGYHLARKVEAKQIDGWEYFKLTAADAVSAGVLDQSSIDQAEQRLPKGVFMELYYGIPNESSSNKFCYSFDEVKHVGKCAINPDYPVYLSFDFNYNPICCAIIQHYNGTIYVPRLVKLENSNIYMLCAQLRSILAFPTKRPMVLVTGDATGANNSAALKDNLNYYRIIKTEMRLGDSQLMVPTHNPSMEQNQVLINAILEHYKVQVDPEGATALVFDCKFVQVGVDKKIIKSDRTDAAQQADALDTFRYWLNRFMGHFVKLPQNYVHLQSQPTNGNGSSNGNGLH